jgi:thiol-disulfide isomerase/thioredoxin
MQKMKTYKILLAISAIIISFAACDKIEPPYTIEPEKPKTDKNVFLEFYTGHLDENATTSYEELLNLKEEFGDRLQIMAIHAGENAAVVEAPFDMDLTSVAGDEYFTHFNVTASNNALINRAEFEGSRIIAPANWDTCVRKQLAMDGELKISIVPELEESTLSGTVKLEMFQDISSQLSLQLYLVEDSITAAQQTQSGVNDSFIHRFVLRDVLNGNWGEDLSSASYAFGDKEDISISNYDIPANWNKGRLSIIAMVYDKTRETVLQVSKQSIDYEEDNTVPERVKRVLLEDFTGQKCVNCPTAHEIAETLHGLYGDDLVTVAVHAGFFATPASAPYTYDFRTTAGNEYETFFSVQTYPTGMVNRVNTGGNYLIDKDGWGTAAALEFEKETALEVTIKPSSSANSISGEIELYFFEDFNTQAKIQIYVIEDNIVKPQVTPEGDDLEYNHMHVLRGAINGSWGEVLTSNSFAAEERTSITFSNYPIGDDWNTDELYLVAYVYDATTLEVLQVNKKKLVN